MQGNKVCNSGAERGVLAGLCRFGKQAYYDVSDIIGVNSFGFENNQALYKSVEKAFETSETIDATAILASAEALGLDGILTKNKTDIDFIRSLFNFPIQLPNVRILAKQVAKLEYVRKGQAAHLEAYDKLGTCDGTEPIDHIVSISENAVFDLTNEINNSNDNTPVKLCETAKDRLDFLAKNPVKMKGIPTPYPIFNELIGGGLRTGVHLVAARPKIGKSSHALNCGWHVADVLDIPTLYVDTELVPQEQEDRLIALVSGIYYRLIETGQFAQSAVDAKKVYDAIDKIKKSRFYHKWVGGKSFEEITSIMRRWIYSTVGFDANGNTNPHLIIYDYFKLMDASVLSTMQEHQAIGFQVSYLSDFAKKYDSPILSYIQVNRDGITKESSDIIAQSDRLLWLCTSCSVFRRKEPEEINEDGGMRNGNRKLSILETRFGEPLEFGDYVCMNLDGKIAQVKELKTKFQLMNQKDDTGFEVSDEKQNEVLDEDIQ